MRIFLDMDGVIADFVGGAARIHGVPRKDLIKAWPPGEYGIEKALAEFKANGICTHEEFWSPINNRLGFWRELLPFPWTQSLIKLANILADGDVWYVSSTSRYRDVIVEKQDWLLSHGIPRDRLIPTAHKWLLAKNGVLLIDDYDRNVKEFIIHGGTALTFPAHHNRLHQHADSPYEHLIVNLIETFETSGL